MLRIFTKAVFLIIIFSTGNNVFAQDLIVTIDNDSINCEINFISEKGIDYIYLNSNRKRVPVFISKSDILTFKTGYLPKNPIGVFNRNRVAVNRDSLNKARTEKLQSSKVTINKKEPVNDKPYVELGFNLGYGYRLIDIPANYSTEMKNGLVISGDITRFNRMDNGLFFSYNRFFKKISEDFTAQTSSGTVSFSASDNFIIQFFNVGYCKKTKITELVNGRVMLGGGYIFYEDEGTIANLKGLVNGKTLGLNLGFYIDNQFDNKAYLTLGLSVFLGNLTEYSATLGGRNLNINKEPINLGLIQASIGLRFGK